jgi:hypothetical protein
VLAPCDHFRRRSKFIAGHAPVDISGRRWYQNTRGDVLIPVDHFVKPRESGNGGAAADIPPAVDLQATSLILTTVKPTWLPRWN